jgi:uncharacterized cupredoxin-like copper-binding protein
MRRLIVSLSVVVVLLVGVIASFGRGATAQEATPDATAMMAMAMHPVVGGWRLTNDAGEGNTFPSLAIFHADGTYTEVLPDGSVLTGVWQSTGERTADLTLFSNYIVDDKLVQGEGRFSLEVDETGNALSQAGVFVGRFEDGSIEFAADVQSPGVRLEVAPLVPLETLVGTPMAGTPTAGAEETVAVSLTEFAIDMPTDLAAGPITFQVTNDGTTDHNFEVEGQGIEEELPQNLAPGQSGTLSLDLAPGTYEVYCPVGNHADEGMRLELTVTE